MRIPSLLLDGRLKPGFAALIPQVLSSQHPSTYALKVHRLETVHVGTLQPCCARRFLETSVAKEGIAAASPTKSDTRSVKPSATTL
jgi:hypothetical protein